MANTTQFHPNLGPIGAGFPVGGIFHGTIDLKTLNDGGFLNIQGPPLALDQRIQSHAAGRIARIDMGVDKLLEMMPIHPCFGRDKWDVMNLKQTAYDKDVLGVVQFDYAYREMTDEEWAAIEPAMREATMFLDDPMILEWYGGLILGDWTKLPSKIGNKDLGEIWSFDTLSEEYKRQHPGWETEVWRILAQGVAYKIRWSFGPTNNHGFTLPADGEGFAPETSDSIIIINEDYLRVCTGDLKATDFPRTLSEVDPNDPTKLPYYDQHAAKIRSIHGLTITTLHELQHAIVHAVYKNFDRKNIREPFFRDQRVAEAGFAFEQFMFRGVLNPIGPSDIVGVAAHPYGSEFDKFPGIRMGFENRAKGSLAKYGVYGQNFHALHMEQICRFFDQRFWDTNVRRWGLDAIWYERTPRFKVFLRPRVGAGLKWPGESPSIKFSSP